MELEMSNFQTLSQFEEMPLKSGLFFIYAICCERKPQIWTLTLTDITMQVTMMYAHWIF